MRKLLILLVLLLMTVTLNGASILDDDFEGGTNPGWFTHYYAPSIATDGGGSGSNYLTVQGDDFEAIGQAFLRYFPLQTLAVGDSIEVSWQAKIQVFGTGGNNLRFGLYNSGGTQITSNVAFTDSDLADYTGYTFMINNTRANSASGVYASLDVLRRDGSNNILYSYTPHTRLGLFETLSYHEILGSNAWSPVQRLTITRTATGWDITTTLGGIQGNETYLPLTHKVSVEDTSPVTSFDTLGIWYRTQTGTYSFSIDNIKIKSPAELVPVEFEDIFDDVNDTAEEWFTHLNEPNVIIDTNATVGTPGFLQADGEQTQAYGQQFLRYFNAKTLAVGDSVELTWQAKISHFAASTTTNLLRFGLYNSAGSKITTDVAFSDAALADYTGYAFFINKTRAYTGNDDLAMLEVMERVSSNNTLISTSAHELRERFQSVSYHETMGLGQWTPTQRLTMTRTATGWDITTTLGGDLGHGYDAITRYFSIEDPTPETTFDTVGIWYRTLTGEGTFSIDNVVVKFPAEFIPQPDCLIDIVNQGFGLVGDVSGPGNQPDCRVDLYDLAAMSVNWLGCVDPQDETCDSPF